MNEFTGIIKEKNWGAVATKKFKESIDDTCREMDNISSFENIVKQEAKKDYYNSQKDIVRGNLPSIYSMLETIKKDEILIKHSLMPDDVSGDSQAVVMLNIDLMNVKYEYKRYRPYAYYIEQSFAKQYSMEDARDVLQEVVNNMKKSLDIFLEKEKNNG